MCASVLEEMFFGVLAVFLFLCLTFRVLKVVVTTNLGVNPSVCNWKNSYSLQKNLIGEVDDHNQQGSTYLMITKLGKLVKSKEGSHKAIESCKIILVKGWFCPPPRCDSLLGANGPFDMKPPKNRPLCLPSWGNTLKVQRTNSLPDECFILCQSKRVC